MKFPRIAILDSTGLKIVVKRPQDFKADLMKWWVPEEVEPVKEVAAQAPAEEFTGGDMNTDERAKFEELKASRAWLRPESKDEYARLKAIYG